MFELSFLWRMFDDLFATPYQWYKCKLILTKLWLTVVNLSKGNTYLTSLFVWCMSGALRVFDGKTCVYD